ncbi:MAG TPA: isoprenylcysteine carboxylmethyltransferase family protein [Sphingomicrobium sp.]
MARAAVLLFSAIAYAVFFATFLYLIAFVGDLPFVPRTVDRGPEGAIAIAVVVNLALIASFGLQHSVMARPGFKRVWTRVVPPPVERSVYVLAASLMLILLFAAWRPIPGVVWDLTRTAFEWPLWLLFGAGWLIVLVSTFLINHFELFGLQQAWLNLRGRQAAAPQLRQPLFYRWVAHPLYSGFFLAFWAAPQMSYGHLLLAIGMSAYMLIAIQYEERDLTDHFGDDYRRYRAGVGMLAPRLRSRA